MGIAQEGDKKRNPFFLAGASWQDRILTMKLNYRQQQQARIEDEGRGVTRKNDGSVVPLPTEETHERKKHYFLLYFPAIGNMETVSLVKIMHDSSALGIKNEFIGQEWSGIISFGSIGFHCIHVVRLCHRL